jgi:hypothetical protein
MERRNITIGTKRIENIQKATLAQVNAAIKKYVDPNAFVIVEAGTFSKSPVDMTTSPIVSPATSDPVQSTSTTTSTVETTKTTTSATTTPVIIVTEPSTPSIATTTTAVTKTTTATNGSSSSTASVNAKIGAIIAPLLKKDFKF